MLTELQKGAQLNSLWIREWFSCIDYVQAFQPNAQGRQYYTLHLMRESDMNPSSKLCIGRCAKADLMEETMHEQSNSHKNIFLTPKVSSQIS